MLVTSSTADQSKVPHSVAQ